MLKNNQYYVDLSKVGASIQLPLAAANTNQPVTFAFETSNIPDTIPVYVNVASPSVLNTPVTATLGLDTAYLNQYNQQQLAQDSTFVPYELLPDSVYSVSGWNVTVPAGQRLANINVIIYTSKLDATHKYILPITITSASLPIENWNHLLLNISAKNEWDGSYNVHVHIDGANSYAGTDFTDSGVQLHTQGVNSVYENSIADFFGGYTLYTFNSDGTMSVLAGPSAANPNGYGAAVVESSYDQSNHSFHLKYTILSGKYIFTLDYQKQ
ncbi:uncharacterized protein DUF1735 [Thermoflavifilum aggregans]|uniref:Uncharacterized protein DUF1735 n=2 Tax=Thermoflavifilum aggregans TaxID=454188 RepID=A0A2M9CWX5_9BACT|nr:uncharacterized protein DUF1735 [Thermoflavifilum aggregans]